MYVIMYVCVCVATPVPPSKTPPALRRSLSKISRKHRSVAPLTDTTPECLLANDLGELAQTLLF